MNKSETEPGSRADTVPADPRIELAALIRGCETLPAEQRELAAQVIEGSIEQDAEIERLRKALDSLPRDPRQFSRPPWP